jgi:hypothetical protein
MSGMGQKSTVDESTQAYETTDELTESPDTGDETWQQPTLLAAPERALIVARPAEPLRRAGLVGIAKARAALAAAVRRAEDTKAAAREGDRAA